MARAVSRVAYQLGGDSASLELHLSEKDEKINNFIQDVMVEVVGSLSTDKRKWRAHLAFKDVHCCCDQEVGALAIFVVKCESNYLLFDAKYYAEHENGYVRLPHGRVIWSVPYPKLVPKGTMDHLNGKILHICMVAELTHARFSGDIKDNRIWNLDDCSKAENICRQTFTTYGFGPLKKS